MSFVPWILVALNIAGAGLMVRYGLPKEVPLIGREDSDPVLGLLGLGVYVCSIAIRVALTITN